MVKELHPAPEKAIDLLERMAALEEAVRQLREDLNASIQAFSSLKSDVQAGRVDAHKPLHEAQSKKLASMTERLTALEELWSLEEAPKPRQIDKRDILLALLKQSRSEWVPMKNIRKKMGMGRDEFSRLIDVSREFIEIEENKFDRRQKRIKIH